MARPERSALTDDGEAKRGRLRWNLLPTAVIIAASAWVFAPAIHGDWLWDDPLEISDNLSLRSLAGLREIWIGGPAAGQDYLPLKSTVEWLQWHLWGDRVTGYHATNVALHVLAALLLWRVLRKLGLSAGAGWLGAAIFALHPLAVESVVWISELKNVLSLPLMLLSFAAYLDYDGKGRRRDWWRALLWFVVAMLCKSSVAMLPGVLLLQAWWRHGRVGWNRVRDVLPFFVVALALGGVTIWFQAHRAMSGEGAPPEGLVSRLGAAGLAAAFYAYKCIFPLGLMPIYPRWTTDPVHMSLFLPWLFPLAAARWIWRRRPIAEVERAFWFGIGGFFLNLIPALGIVPMAYSRITWVADHFAYISLACFAGVAAAGVAAVASWRAGGIRRVTWTLVGAILVVFAIESHRYAAVFRSREALWSYTVEYNPQSWTAHYNLGLEFTHARRLAEAAAEFTRTVQLKPDHFAAQTNLGNLLVMSGRPAEALEHYEAALQVNPMAAEPHNDMGIALFRLHRLDAAIAQYQQALRLRPDYPEAAANLQRALRVRR